MESGAVGHNIERGPPKDHPSQICFNLVQQFQRRRFKCDLLNPVHIHTPTCFQEPDIFRKFIKKYHITIEWGKFDSVFTWSLNIPVSSIMMFVILHFFNLLYFSQIYIGKKVPDLSNHSL
jgi:hypothetical protein